MLNLLVFTFKNLYIFCSFRKVIALILLFLSFPTTNIYAAGAINQPQMTSVINQVIQPLMQKYHIPGMAVAITMDGKNYFYNYGMASEKTHQPITNQTLFEIGSVTKTFTATLASYAAETKKLSLSNNTSQYLPPLRGLSFDKISLLNLGTHTSGLPLFVPDDIKTTQQLMDYLQHWKPAYPIGTHRVYSNIGIGLLGLSAAASLQDSYNNLLNKLILSPLGLNHTYLKIPANQLANYAQGYTVHNTPIRMSTVALWPETYGLKSCTADLIKYLEANMQEIPIAETLQRALSNTHIAYFKSTHLTQDLIWEQYPYPVTLKQLLIGNDDIYRATPVTKITPLLPPQTAVFINKTGSTNGFSAYVAFMPDKKLGIVILANKAYPVAQRVMAGYKILSRLEKSTLN